MSQHHEPATAAPTDNIGYVELASPQILDDQWREMHFDQAPGQNVLQDFVAPEVGAGYVYRDAKLVGSASQNRFLYWRTANDVLELVEVSTEAVLDGNQVRIRFNNSPIVNDIKVIEFSDSIVLLFATFTSVHRLYLPHPKLTSKSILEDLTPEVLFNPSNYYLLHNHASSSSQQPICAASWYDKMMLKCALTFPDSTVLIVQFGHNTHHITTSEIKQTGIIGRLWSRMPNLWARSPNDCDNAIFVCVPYHHAETDDVLLFTLCRDCRIRIFSTTTRECLCTHNMIPQSSFSQSFATHTNPTTELPSMKLSGSLAIIYLTENRPEFIFLQHKYQSGVHMLSERCVFQTPMWEKLIDFSITNYRIWALANIRDSETTLCYMDIAGIPDDQSEEEESMTERSWDFVTLSDDIELSGSKSLVAEIFWSNHFSVKTVQKALVGITGPAVPKRNNMSDLEELAFTRIVDDNQDEAWARFYDYCIQNHLVENKNIGLLTREDESVVCIIKRSNPSFVCPWFMDVDMELQAGPYRGIRNSPTISNLIQSLNYIHKELINEEQSQIFEQKLYESPMMIELTVDKLLQSLVKSKHGLQRIHLPTNKATISSSIDYICEQLDLTESAIEYGTQILKEYPKNMRLDHNPLESNSGIIITFELFRRLVRARMTLARDLLIYINIVKHLAEIKGDKLLDFIEHLYISKTVKRIIDSLRSYSVLCWLAETPIKSQPTRNNLSLELMNMIADRFEFFKEARDYSAANNSLESSSDRIIQQNLFMNFLAKGGSNYSWSLSQVSQHNQALSNSLYVTDVALNICKLLWPTTQHLCLPEFLFTNQLDDHLSKYLDLTQEWSSAFTDRHFMRACNCLLQNRALQSVEILNRIWMKATHHNLLGRFIGVDSEIRSESAFESVAASPQLIYNYYERLIDLFELINNRECLVSLINHCMSLLDENADLDQQHWVNCMRAKLFQYYLELDDSDEAYHTMVLTSDPSLRTNCLRKFIVSHCEKEQWSNLLSYPFIDIKDDFIDILNQKAESMDLSILNPNDFYKTTYYDILFASYVSDEEFKRAAQLMYNYARRLAQEVPGITSIRKQADCLLIALNSLRCIDESERTIECGGSIEDGRSSVLKRSHDADDNAHKNVSSVRAIGCKEIEKKYELTRARILLLERDQSANAIALSPLSIEETIAQLVASSMFSVAVDLALLFRTSMDSILEGLAAKYILVMRLSTVDIAMHQEVERSLSDLFTNSYSTIDTYNYVANSTSPLVEKLWRLIDYYLTIYDGVSHRYTKFELGDSPTWTTVLMRVVANKLLSSGYDVPASLRRMYTLRYTPELLKLLIKYDKLIEAADLAMEMIDKLLEPTACFAFNTPHSEPPPIYLPTHLIILLISYLNEDATNTHHIKVANALTSKLNKFRNFVKSY